MELQASFRSNKVSELIKTEQNEQGEVIVSGRELHDFLEVGTEYRKWFPRMTEYGFEENVDYVRVSQKCPTLGGMQEIVDHAVKIDMAKEIAMLQRSERGKQARQYFLQLEKLWNSPEMVMQRALEFSKKQIDVLVEKTFQLESKVEKLTHSGKLYTADEIAKELGFSAVKLNKELHAKEFQYKRNGTWLPYSKHSDKGYVSIKQGEYNGKVVYDRKFTEEGRQFILELFN